LKSTNKIGIIIKKVKKRGFIMSLTKEDLQAISDLIDVKLEEYDTRIQGIVQETEERLLEEANEISKVIAVNCYDIVDLRHKINNIKDK